MSTIIVCGGRSYGRVPADAFNPNHAREQARAERGRLYVILREAVARLAATRFVMGDATGADYLAAGWCKENGVAFKVYPADWQTHGNAAGPIRNQQMLDEEKPTAVIGFPGSRGTRNMCSLAEKAGIRVIKVDW